jgi:hypothetical protein
MEAITGSCSTLGNPTSLLSACEKWRVARDTRYFITSKQARKVDAQRETQQKRLDAAKAYDFLIGVRRTSQVKYKILKIEPEQIFLASNSLKECAWILSLV